MNPLLLPELREMVRDKDTEELRGFLTRIHPAQAADLIDGLDSAAISWVLEILPNEREAQIFPYLPERLQEDLAAGAARSELAKLLNEISPDDRADFVRRLPEKTREGIIPLLAEAARKDVTRLLSFDPASAGSRMNTSYAAVHEDSTCGEALQHVRQEAPDKETIYTIYVIDHDRVLKGVIGLKDLLLARPETPVRALMRSELLSVKAEQPATHAAERCQRYDLLAVPIIDDQGRLLGIVTVDDLMDVMQKEVTRDILSMGAVEPGALDQAYLENPVRVVVRKRIGWLLLLFVTEMLTGTVLRHYDEALARVVSLAFFIPLLIGTGGNAGSQAVSTIIRSLALKEIVPSQWKPVLARELCTGLSLGILLGLVGVVRSLMWEPSNFALAGTVGLSLVAICAWSNSVAALVPLFAQRVGVDPTVLSAPLIATLVDATGLIIYFNVAFLLIPALTTPIVPLPGAVVAKLSEAAQAAPPEWAAKINEIAQAQTERLTHPNEWLFPTLAIVIVIGVLLAASRRRQAAQSIGGRPAR